MPNENPSSCASGTPDELADKAGFPYPGLACDQHHHRRAGPCALQCLAQNGEFLVTPDKSKTAHWIVTLELPVDDVPADQAAPHADSASFDRSETLRSLHPGTGRVMDTGWDPLEG